VLILRNKSGKALCLLSNAVDVAIDLKYNEVSTLTFTIADHVDGQPTEGYAKIIGLRTVELRGIGLFVLMNPETSNDGIVEKKKCTCYSLEHEFVNKQIFMENGTFNFWNPLEPGKTVLGEILRLMPSWSPGAIDSALIGKWRTFDVKGENVYNFMKGTLQKAYQCIFFFDTYNRLIHVRDANRIATPNSVYISLDNLAKKIDVNEDTDGIVTVLDVNGADGVNIRSVNPDGTNKIINLDYFMTEDNFPAGMIQKYLAWKAVYQQSRTSYYNLSVEFVIQTMRMVTETAALTDMFGEKTKEEAIQATIVQGIAKGTHVEADLNAVNARIQQCEIKIATQEALLTGIQATLDGLHNSLVAINVQAKISAHFSSQEMLLLDRYYKEDSIEESTFVAAQVQYFTDTPTITNDFPAGVQVTGASISGVPGVNGKTIYNITGGTVTIPGKVSAGIRRGTLERAGTGDIVMSVLMADGTINGETMNSGTISLTGKAGAIQSDMAPDPDAPGLTKGTQLSFVVNTGYLYATKNTSEYERHAVSWDLYEYGEEVIKKLSQPTFHFTIDSGNFFTAEGFDLFRRSLKLGEKVYLHIGDEMVLQPIVVGVSLSFDNWASLTLTFSDSWLSGENEFRLVDLLEQSISMGKSVDSGKFSYLAFVDSGAQTDIRRFMDSALDVAKNAIMSSRDQAITFDEAGLRLRKWTDASHSVYSPKQIWMSNNSIMLTRDGWNTASIAIGEFRGPSGEEMYGILAENIFGRMLAGNQLIIESDSRYGGTAVFRVDGNGVTINNGNISVTSTCGNQILLNPDVGFVMGRNLYTGGSAINVDNANFWAEPGGSLYMRGTLFSDGGSIINNGSIAVTSTSGNQIVLNPDAGFVMGRNIITSGGAVNTGNANFWADASGNLTMKGTVYAEGGSIKIMGPTFGTEIIPGRIIFYKYGIATGSVGIDSSDGKLTLAVEKVVAENISDYDLVGPGAPPPKSGLTAVITWVVSTVFGPLINLINPTISRVAALEWYWTPVASGGGGFNDRVVALENWRVGVVAPSLSSLQAQIDTLFSLI